MFLVDNLGQHIKLELSTPILVADRPFLAPKANCCQKSKKNSELIKSILIKLVKPVSCLKPPIPKIKLRTKKEFFHVNNSIARPQGAPLKAVMNPLEYSKFPE